MWELDPCKNCDCARVSHNQSEDDSSCKKCDCPKFEFEKKHVTDNDPMYDDPDWWKKEKKK